MQEVRIYTDGACKGNPGRGGWGVILEFNDTTFELSGSETMTTSNRMELTAVIKGLSLLKIRCKVIVFSDSKYLVDGITKWIIKWQENNWYNFKKEPVKNKDLWEKLYNLSQNHDIKWVWVKRDNEKIRSCQALANKAIDNK